MIGDVKMKVRILKTVTLLMLCLVLVLPLASCASDGAPEGYQLVACDGDAFRLYVPTNGWVPNTSGGVTGAYTSLDDGAFVEVVEVDDAGEMTLEEYWAYTDAQNLEDLKGYSSNAKSEKCVLGGMPAQKNVYSATVTVSGKETVYKYVQITAQYKGETYVLIYGAPEAAYDGYTEVFEGNADGEGILPYFAFDEPYELEDKKEFSDKVTAPEGMKLASTDERAYRFFVPESWRINERTDISAAYASETDSSNVSLQMHMVNDESESIDEFFSGLEEKYAGLFLNFATVSETDVKMSGLNAKKYELSMSSGGVEYRMIQAVVKKGTVFYVFTYTAVAESFEKHLPDVEKMIESFEIR